MSRKKPRIRLYVDVPLMAGQSLTLDRSASHYVLSVMRLEPDDGLLLFNGRDGEWQAHVTEARKKAAVLSVDRCIRSQDTDEFAQGPLFVFAPVKRGPMDLIVEKATELGAGAIQPVLTARTNMGRINMDRLVHITREAAEQCGRLSLPVIREPVPLSAFLRDGSLNGPLYFCDEAGDAPPLLSALQENRHVNGAHPPCGILVGPEGGFDDRERVMIRDQKFVRAVGLGNLVLRAETAAIMALSLMRAVIDDRNAGLQ